MPVLRAHLALALCLAGYPVVADDIKVPAKIEGKPGEFLKIPAETSGAVVRWRVIDPGLNLFPMELLRDTKTAVAVALLPGKFRVLAWTSIKDVPTDAVECLVVVTSGPPPGPEPPPDPPDPVVTELRAALAKEASDRPLLSELSKVCLNVSEAARDSEYGDVKAVRDLFATQVGARIAPKLPHVRGVLVRFLDSKLPTTAVPLTDELRTTISRAFDYLAASLERINQ
jgi:hypothetical protein